MADEHASPVPLSFWIVASLALVWNLFGLYVFYTQESTPPEQLATQLTAEQVALIEATPFWATSASAIAVLAGVAGCVLLLLRKAWAVPVFIVSLVAIIVQDIYVFGLTNTMQVFGGQVLVIQSLVLIIAVALVWYSRSARERGWLT